MCHKGKCMYCMDVETGSLIFAIFKIVITSMGAFASAGGLVYINCILEVAIEDAKVSEGHMGTTRVHIAQGTNEALAVLCVSHSIAFAFAVVLIFGICKRKAGLVKTYFVYGIIKMVFAVAIIILGLSIYMFQSIVGMLFFVYLFYAPILYMIHMTYKKFEKANGFTVFTNPITVIEKF